MEKANVLWDYRDLPEVEHYWEHAIIHRDLNRFSCVSKFINHDPGPGHFYYAARYRSLFSEWVKGKYDHNGKS